jgi:predicted AAA+ superfamily ATPase
MAQAVGQAPLAQRPRETGLDGPDQARCAVGDDQLVQRGLSESLTGRFEVLPLPHTPLIGDQDRWTRYIRDALIETTIARDVLLLTRVDKPALLRRLFELGCRYSGQVLSYTKMLGQLQDAGNTVTLAHYLELLAAAGMLTGLPKYAGRTVRTRGSSPKLQVLNTALLTAQWGLTLQDARGDRETWGRLAESAVGAHLANAAMTGTCEVFYWRERQREVDFVVMAGRTLTAIEVKTGRRRETLAGMDAFVQAFKPHRTLLVGGGGIPLDTFLLQPVEHWVTAR